jgi:AcrR family transcriptional regulator
MIKTEDPTREKILISALAVFSERGISKTSLNEVAYRAGVTRVTVYRHFADKKELVRAAFLRVEQVFEKGLADLKRNPREDGEKILNQIGEGLSALPSSDAFARMDELKRLYPDVYSSVQEVRVSTLSGLFENLFAATKRQGRLKSGLKGQFVRAVFLELAINLFENPRLKSFGLSDAELYLAIKDLFCVGFLGAVKARSERRPHGH